MLLSVKSSIYLLRRNWLQLLVVCLLCAILPALFYPSRHSALAIIDLNRAKNVTSPLLPTTVDEIQNILSQNDIRTQLKKTLELSKVSIFLSFKEDKERLLIESRSNEKQKAVSTAQVFAEVASKTLTELRQKRLQAEHIRAKATIAQLSSELTLLKSKIAQLKASAEFKKLEIVERSIEDVSTSLVELHESRTTFLAQAQDAEKLNLAYLADQKTIEYKNQLKEVELNYLQNSLHLGPRHPRMLALAQRKDAIALRLKAHRAAFDSVNREKVQIIDHKIASLQSILDEHKTFLNNNQGILSDLQLSEEKSKSISEQLSLLNAKRMKLESLATQNQFAEIIERAKVIPQLSSRYSFADSVYLFLICLILGVSILLLRALLNPRLISSSFASEYLSIPTVCEIPHFTKPREESRRYYLPLLDEKSKDYLPSKSLAQTTASTAQPQNLAQAIEGFREIRTQLLSKENSGKIIAVTSSYAGEGKTTIASNMAISFARSRKRTLLVKADLEKPDGSSTLSGLTDYLIDSKGLDEVVYSSGLDNLWITPAGNLIEGGSDLISSRKFEHFLEVVDELFDHIIIDAPELFQRSDSLIISRYAAQTILVADRHRTDRRDVKKAIQRVQRYGGRVSSVILNDASSASFGSQSRNDGQELLLAV